MKIQNLTKTYFTPNGNNTVFKNLSFKIERNKFHCMIGPSGCGKTTLLNILSDLTPPDSGTVICEAKSGQTLTKGYVFQDDSLLPWKTVSENLNLVLKSDQLSQSERKTTIHSFLEKMGMLTKSHCFPSGLSGGERQRINLARALVINPDIIFMDEPFSHLDELTATKLRVELLKLWENQPKTVVMVTHNIIEAIYLADIVYVFSADKDKSLHKIPIHITRPRSHDFFTDFVFNHKTQQLIRQIQQKLKTPSI